VKQDLDREVVKDFQLTGTVHVLAISGLHVGFIILILHLVLSILRFPVNLKRAGIIVGLVFYVFLVDFKISVVRSALMASLYLIGQFLQRDVKPLNILGGSGLIILLVDPRQLFLPGFQFSFCAVGSILYGFPKLNILLSIAFPFLQTRIKWRKYIYQSLLISLVTTFGTIPLTWYYFGYVPLVGILLNLIIIPAIGIFVCSSIIFLLINIVPAMPVAGFSELLTAGIEMLLAVVQRVANLSELLFYLPALQIWKLSLLYLIFILMCNLDKSRIRYTLYTVITTCALVILVKEILHPNKVLDVWFLDVGQGDASIVITPSGESIVIDAG
jgi:competence protein ComEC